MRKSQKIVDGGSDDENADGKKSKKKNPNKRRKKDGEFGVSRGLDFRGVSFVVNVDLPTSPDSYTHRIGRTARGGANGVALTLVDSTKSDEAKMLFEIQESQPAKLPSGAAVDGDLKGTAEGVENGIESGMDDIGMANAQPQKQPCPLDFDLNEIEGFRYRVEDGEFRYGCFIVQLREFFSPRITLTHNCMSCSEPRRHKSSRA